MFNEHNTATMTVRTGIRVHPVSRKLVASFLLACNAIVLRGSRVQVLTTLVYSHLVCLPPAGVFSHVMFNLIICLSLFQWSACELAGLAKRTSTLNTIALHCANQFSGCQVPISSYFFLFFGAIPIFSYLFKKTSYFSYFLVHGVQRMKIFMPVSKTT